MGKFPSSTLTLFEAIFWIDIKLQTNNVTEARWSDHTLVSESSYPVSWVKYKDLKSSCAYYCSDLANYKDEFCRAPCGAKKSFMCEVDFYKYHINTNIKFKTRSLLVPCPDKRKNWFFFNGFCYYSSGNDTPDLKTKNWKAARTFCRDNGAELMSIHNDYDIDFALKLVSSKEKVNIYHKKKKHFWIGLSRMGIGESFNWSDGSPVNFLYWDNSQPNSYEFSACGSLSPLNAFWSDHDCNKQLYYVCQRISESKVQKKSKPIFINGSCLPSWAPYGNKCFKYFKEAKTYEEALETCRSFGPSYDLASVGDKMEDDFLRLLALTLSAMNVRIGMISDDNGVEFHWSDSSRVTFSRITEKHLKYKFADTLCAAIQTHFSKWRLNDCEVRMPFICQGYRDPTLPALENNQTCLKKNSYKFLNGCYEFIYGQRNQKSWTDAQKYCERMGGNLLSILSKEEMLFISYTWRKFLPQGTNLAFWLGMVKEKPTLFHWQDGWPIGFTYWDQTAVPLASPGEENGCLVLRSANSRWIFQDCKKLNNFICKVTPDKVKKLPPAFEGRCPQIKRLQFFDIGTKYCYTKTYSNKWSIAELECKQIGGHLTSIHSRKEAEVLSRYFSKNDTIWIGLYKDGKGSLKWIDNTPVNYLNVKKAKVAYDDHDLDCAAMNTLSLNWHIAHCSKYKLSLCAVEKVPGNESKTTGKLQSPGVLRSTVRVNLIWILIGAGAVILCIILLPIVIHMICLKKRNQASILSTNIDSSRSRLPSEVSEI